MAKETIRLRAPLEKSSGADLRREMVTKREQRCEIAGSKEAARSIGTAADMGASRAANSA